MARRHLYESREREDDHDVVRTACGRGWKTLRGEVPLLVTEDLEEVDCMTCENSAEYQHQAGKKNGNRPTLVPLVGKLVGCRLLEGDEYSSPAKEGVGFSRRAAVEDGYFFVIGSTAFVITESQLEMMRAERRKGK